MIVVVGPDIKEAGSPGIIPGDSYRSVRVRTAREALSLAADGRVAFMVIAGWPGDMAAADFKAALRKTSPGTAMIFGTPSETRLSPVVGNRPEIMKQVFLSTDTALALAELSGRIATVNPAFLRLWGFDTEEDVTGRQLPELCEETGENWLNCDEGGFNERKLIKRKDGTLVPVLSATDTVVDQTGVPVALMSFFRDISAVVRAEEALRESEERYRNLVERAQDGILIIRDGTVIFANGSLGLMADMPLEEIIGLPFTDHILPRDRAAVMERYRARIRGEPVESLFELTLLGRGDQMVEAEVSAGLIQYEGEPCDLVIVRDVSKRKKAELALRESEERYRMLADLSPEGIFVIAGGLVVFANISGAALLAEGGTPADVVGLDVTSLVHPEMHDRVVYLMKKAASGQYRRHFIREQVRRKDETVINLELGVEPITYRGGPALLVVAHDVTGQHEAEKAVLQANRKLNLLSSVTRHDILNQLNVLGCYIELAADVPASQRPDEYLSDMKAVAGTIERQIRFTRDYQNMGIQQPKWQRLGDIVGRCTNLAGGKGIKMETEVGSVELFADPLLERVFANLIDNTLRHGDGATTVRFWYREDSAGLSLFFEDDGCGIPEPQKQNIFLPGVGRNHGYGLFLIKEILAITGMEIAENGREGEGARFEITVPSAAWREARTVG